jgi:hypothetical protein
MAWESMQEVFVQKWFACLDAMMHWTAPQVTVECLVVGRWVAGHFLVGHMAVVDTAVVGRVVVAGMVVVGKVVAGKVVVGMAVGDKVVVHSTTAQVAAVGPSVVSH